MALLLCLLAAALFDRFDPARGYRKLKTSPALAPPVLAPEKQIVNGSPEGAASAVPESSEDSGALSPEAGAVILAPLKISAQKFRFHTVLAAELRLLFKGQRWWWYTVAAGLLLAQTLVSNADGRGMVLAFAWIWPILLWSSMGMRELRYQTHQILFAAPHPMARQLPAAWLAGVLLAVVTGSGFAFRLVLEKNLPGLFAWTVGALFIPTAALCLGVWSSSSKPFEILYTLLWYIGPMHAMPAFDFMGSSPATAKTHYPLYYLAFTAILFVLAVAGRKRQLLL